MQIRTKVSADQKTFFNCFRRLKPSRLLILSFSATVLQRRTTNPPAHALWLRVLVSSRGETLPLAAILDLAAGSSEVPGAAEAAVAGGVGRTGISLWAASGLGGRGQVVRPFNVALKPGALYWKTPGGDPFMWRLQRDERVHRRRASFEGLFCLLVTAEV